MKMTKEKYENLLFFFRKNSRRLNCIRFLAKKLPLIEAAVYLFIAATLLLLKREVAIKFIFIPAVAFVATTVFRKLINRRRPYEVFDFKPLLKYKEDKGQSFPSRHTVSAWIIAFAFLKINLPLGIVFIIIALLISTARVCSGMHYPTDVLGGFVFALLLEILLNFLPF